MVNMKIDDLVTWEKEIHQELTFAYESVFANSPFFEITYREFVVYCYNHSSHGRLCRAVSPHV